MLLTASTAARVGLFSVWLTSVCLFVVGAVHYLLGEIEKKKKEIEGGNYFRQK